MADVIGTISVPPTIGGVIAGQIVTIAVPTIPKFTSTDAADAGLSVGEIGLLVNASDDSLVICDLKKTASGPVLLDGTTGADYANVSDSPASELTIGPAGDIRPQGAGTASFVGGQLVVAGAAADLFYVDRTTEGWLQAVGPHDGFIRQDVRAFTSEAALKATAGSSTPQPEVRRQTDADGVHVSYWQWDQGSLQWVVSEAPETPAAEGYNTIAALRLVPGVKSGDKALWWDTTTHEPLCWFRWSTAFSRWLPSLLVFRGLSASSQSSWDAEERAGSAAHSWSSQGLVWDSRTPLDTVDWPALAHAGLSFSSFANGIMGAMNVSFYGSDGGSDEFALLAGILWGSAQQHSIGQWLKIRASVGAAQSAAQRTTSDVVTTAGARQLSLSFSPLRAMSGFGISGSSGAVIPAGLAAEDNVAAGSFNFFGAGVGAMIDTSEQMTVGLRTAAVSGAGASTMTIAQLDIDWGVA
jgi:hypothetical protein